MTELQSVTRDLHPTVTHAPSWMYHTAHARDGRTILRCRDRHPAPMGTRCFAVTTTYTRADGETWRCVTHFRQEKHARAWYAIVKDLDL